MLSIKKGFSLLELILVLAIASSVSFMKFQDLKNEQESIQAKAIGEQIKQIGNAVNSYISIRYDKISTLTSVASGSGTDPGPRTCYTSTNTCTITYQTLINEGLLPTSFNGINANRSAYSIILKRSGTSPNYIVNGLVTTSTPWIEGGKVRYDLLGQAMENAGVDSGMTKTTSTISGYAGSWNESSTNYDNVNEVGLLGYRVGYDSSMYSIYLRRDGTLPMTGDLNMGGKNITNANNITASGAVSADSITTSGTGSIGGDLSVAGNLAVTGTTTVGGATRVNNTFHATGNSQFDSNVNVTGSVYAGQVTTKNGYGDYLVMGGDAAGGDYEFRMNSTKPLTVWAYNNGKESSSQTRFKVWGTQVNSGDFILNADADGNTTGAITASGNVSGSTFLPTSTSTLGASCSTMGQISKQSDGTPVYCINGYWTNIPVSKTTNGGMIMPNGMKIMWGTLNGTTVSDEHDSTTGIYETEGLSYTPSFTANGKTYTFSNILNVQYSVSDVGGVGQQEQIWGTFSGSSLSFRMASRSITNMTGYYYAVGY